MRVFWWQGGLHLQPESDVETEALIVLLQSFRYERPPEEEGSHRESVRPTGSAESGEIQE
jgi:hypothetical protein